MARNICLMLDQREAIKDELKAKMPEVRHMAFLAGHHLRKAVENHSMRSQYGAGEEAVMSQEVNVPFDQTIRSPEKI